MFYLSLFAVPKSVAHRLERIQEFLVGVIGGRFQMPAGGLGLCLLAY